MALNESIISFIARFFTDLHFIYTSMGNDIKDIIDLACFLFPMNVWGLLVAASIILSVSGALISAVKFIRGFIPTLGGG